LGLPTTRRRDLAAEGGRRSHVEATADLSAPAENSPLTRPKAAQANREDDIAGDPMLRYCTASSGKPAPFQEKSPPGKR
jgi:hypothetical protein